MSPHLNVNGVWGGGVWHKFDLFSLVLEIARLLATLDYRDRSPEPMSIKKKYLKVLALSIFSSNGMVDCPI